MSRSVSESFHLVGLCSAGAPLRHHPTILNMLAGFGLHRFYGYVAFSQQISLCLIVHFGTFRAFVNAMIEVGLRDGNPSGNSDSSLSVGNGASLVNDEPLQQGVRRLVHYGEVETQLRLPDNST